MAEQAGLSGQLGGWNPHAVLACLRCGAEVPLGPEWLGCPSCADGSPLVVAYRREAYPEDASRPPSPASLYEALLPLVGVPWLELGLVPTPLLPVSGEGAPVLMKLEGRNPTGSHKDRFHRVSETVARWMGYDSVVTASTGNHGASAAAYAAAAGLRALVILNPDAPDDLRVQIQSYGATVAVLPSHVSAVVAELVDAGWYPSTSADPTLVGRSNPFGAEGYKSIAYEIVRDLGHVPDAVCLPAASGDLYFGVWKGFDELHTHLGLPMPLLVACQPEGSAPLWLTEEMFASSSMSVVEPSSLALSARDAKSGWHATYALRRSGRPLPIPEVELLAAMRLMGGSGFATEPAGALAVAGALRAQSSGLVAKGAEIVAVVTSSGLNWMRDVACALPAENAVIRSVETLHAVLGSREAVVAAADARTSTLRSGS